MALTLNAEDMVIIENRLPNSLIQELKRGPVPAVLAGGFIRDIVRRDTPSDIDLFVSSALAARELADRLNAGVVTGDVVTTDNAITIRGLFKYPVQIIHRWTFKTPQECIASFDFTITQACVWYQDGTRMSAISDRFYEDLAAMRLVYTAPMREEEAAGSLLRLLKFYSRGFTAPNSSVAAVLARTIRGGSRHSVIHVDDMPAGPIPESVEEAAWADVIQDVIDRADPRVIYSPKNRPGDPYA